MVSSGLIARVLNQKPGPEESKIELVVSKDNPPGTPTESLFSIEATAQDQISSDSDGEQRVLLGINHLDWTEEIGQPKNLRWMHVSNEGLEFNAFLRRALEAYGLNHHQAQTGPISKFFDRFLTVCEQSAFQGGRFRTVPASTFVQLPGDEKKTKVNFLAIPYFLLQNAQTPPRRSGSRSKVHWVQPLVQSGYHLDSSMGREDQQAVRRLHSHITEIIHVPQLWLLTIGDHFIATCSPTPLYDGQRSSLITKSIRLNQFPPTIRVTTASGFSFCLERGGCQVWFEFMYRVHCAVNAPWDSRIDTRTWVYKFQKDGSLLERSHWRSILQSHPDNEPLLILASPGEPEPPKLLEDIIVHGDTTAPDAMELWKKVNQKVLERHGRRQGSAEIFGHHFRRLDESHYRPPTYVLNATRAQLSSGKAQIRTDTESQGPEGKGQPYTCIFGWSLKKSGSDTSSADETVPTQRMRSLLANIHREILFDDNLSVAKNYNNLPLQTYPAVDIQIATLGDTYQGHLHTLDLVSSFVTCVRDIMDLFIDKDHDCLVKGKVWAAVYTIIQTFRHGASEDLLSFQASILSVPFLQYVRQIQGLHDGLDGARGSYITESMVEVFIRIVLLLSESAAEASRLINETQNKAEASHDNGGEQEQPSRLSPAPSRPASESEVAEAGDKRPDPPSTISRSDVDDDMTETCSSARSGGRYRRSSRSRRFIDRTDRGGGGVFSHRLDARIDAIFDHLQRAQDECCAMFCPEEGEEGYSGIDVGRIIALVLDSVTQGHSRCPSMPSLDIEEVYATYTTSLQLEARNRPSKNLLLDINLLREELATIFDNVGQQLDLISKLYSDNNTPDPDEDDFDSDDGLPLNFERLYSPALGDNFAINISTRDILQVIKAGLQDKRDVFEELIKRVDILERQIVQRVDIIQEDHGKAILVFTIVSTIFLPLSFVSSYLGMNTVDIRDMELDQGVFWEVAAPFTVAVVAVVLGVAYNANRLLGWFSRMP